jgi:hypothetical protein
MIGFSADRSQIALPETSNFGDFGIIFRSCDCQAKADDIRVANALFLTLERRCRMTITIRLSDEQAAALQAQAAEEGLTLDIWLQRLAQQYADARSSSSRTTSRPVWELVSDRMKILSPEAFERLPHDGASEHDHYLYGSPKRNQ